MTKTITFIQLTVLLAILLVMAIQLQEDHSRLRESAIGAGLFYASVLITLEVITVALLMVTAALHRGWLTHKYRGKCRTQLLIGMLGWYPSNHLVHGVRVSMVGQPGQGNRPQDTPIDAIALQHELTLVTPPRKRSA
jgi:hypothetical protein